MLVNTALKFNPILYFIQVAEGDCGSIFTEEIVFLRFQNETYIMYYICIRQIEILKISIKETNIKSNTFSAVTRKK